MTKEEYKAFVDVLAAIFSQLFIGNNNKNQQTELF